MPNCYIYVVARDFGFAPNPFHGSCTLATCKPGLRRSAALGDWVVGLGGARLNATGRCVYAMCVSRILSYDEYWDDPTYRDKRPVRNGSATMVVGDNIYHRDPATGGWLQADSHHSNPDGTPNEYNVRHDTQVDTVLISNHFFYFGHTAPTVPTSLLRGLGYQNGRNYRKFSLTEAQPLLAWLVEAHGTVRNLVAADPIDFGAAAMRYGVQDNKLR